MCIYPFERFPNQTSQDLAWIGFHEVGHPTRPKGVQDVGPAYRLRDHGDQLGADGAAPGPPGRGVRICEGARVIRLWRAPWSTNVERVALALAYKGLEVESVLISYADRSPVIAVSGQELVPVIEDEGVVVADSVRILRHLDERRPDPPLWPSDAAGRAEIDLFVDWFNRVWKLAPNAIEAELSRAEPDRARVDELSTQMRAHLDLFEGLLSDRDHLFGDFSAADCVAFPFLKYARDRDPADDEHFHRILEERQRPAAMELPRLLAWIERVDARPRAYG